MTGQAQEFRSGFAAIVGRPNVGKSTLMNRFLGTKLAIVTPKPQTTRNEIKGIATFPDCQIVFLDTPGLHESRGEINRILLDAAMSALMSADVALVVVDAADATGPEAERPALRRVKDAGCPALLVLNKVDLVRKEKLLPLIAGFSKEMEFAAIVPVSAKTGDGMDALLAEVKPRLPVGPRLFSDGRLTDRSTAFLVAEIVREKVFLHTHQEVPYSTAVTVDGIEERPGRRRLVHVLCTIHVERPGQKVIVIGRQGAQLKRIGSEARVEIETLLKSKVFLELFVRVDPDWSRSLKGLQKVGFEA